MENCQSCNSELVTDGLKPGQRFRCANCKAISRFGTIEKVPTDKLAWRSFWLGISSILLLFFTGIPAMYYGIRSLLRMRFVKTKSSDRAAAVTGTVLGGCFGLFFGFIALMIAGVGLAGYLSYQSLDTPDEIVKRCEEIFEFEIPDGFIPVEAEAMMGVESFNFADKVDEDERSARIHLKYFGSTMKTNEPGLINSLGSKSVNGGIGAVRVTELLRWKMLGEETDVRKTIFEPSETNKEILETHQYFALIRHESGYYGMTVVFEPENFDLSEEDVKEIFDGLDFAAEKTITPPQPSKAKTKPATSGIPDSE